MEIAPADEEEEREDEDEEDEEDEEEMEEEERGIKRTGREYGIGSHKPSTHVNGAGIFRMALASTATACNSLAADVRHDDEDDEDDEIDEHEGDRDDGSS
jgi:hypothetical protein